MITAKHEKCGQSVTGNPNGRGKLGCPTCGVFFDAPKQESTKKDGGKK